MKEFGIVINADTRPGYLDDETYCGKIGGMGANGARSINFLTDQVLNKIEFFRGYDIEVTLYIDFHTALISKTMETLRIFINEGKIDNLVIARHSDIYKGKRIRQWQDLNYLHALTMSRSKYLVHFDADSSAYRKNDCDIIDKFKAIIDSGEYNYISYPTYHSPNEGDIPGDNAYPTPEQKDKPDYLWASTRFFFTKREFLDYNKFTDYFDDNVWIKAHEGKPHRYPNVAEQILGFMAGPGKVMYAPKNLDEYMIFCWHTYHPGTLGALHGADYKEVYDYVMDQCGGINGPCDVNEKRNT